LISTLNYWKPLVVTREFFKKFKNPLKKKELGRKNIKQNIKQNDEKYRI